MDTTLNLLVGWPPGIVALHVMLQGGKSPHYHGVGRGAAEAKEYGLTEDMD